MATDTDEPFEAERNLLRDIVAGGTAAMEFDLGGLDEDVVLEFLLHGYIGPCFHHNDPTTAIANVQQLFRRTIGARP